MKKIFLAFAAAFIFISCNQGKGKGEKVDNDTSSVIENKDGSNKISFKVDGAAVSTEGWIVQRFLWDDKTPAPWLNITSNMHMDKRTINVNLNGAAAGTYPISDEGIMTHSHGSYFPDFSSPLKSYSFISGEFKITDIDTVKNILSGTFSGTAKNAEGNTVVISDGQLMKVKIKEGVTNLSAAFK